MDLIESSATLATFQEFGCSMPYRVDKFWGSKKSGTLVAAMCRAVFDQKTCFSLNGLLCRIWSF